MATKVKASLEIINWIWTKGGCTNDLMTTKFEEGKSALDISEGIIRKALLHYSKWEWTRFLFLMLKKPTKECSFSHLPRDVLMYVVKYL